MNNPPPPGIDINTPSTARIYDYMVGGTFNWPADRAVGDHLLQVAPELRGLAISNRRFLSRAVKHVAGLGVNQFLDIGSGLPTQENVHEVAQSVVPAARTVYVDNDPSVLPQAQALIVGDPNTTYIQADVRDPHSILTHPETIKNIDFTSPVCVLMVALLHFVGDQDDPYGIVQRVMEDMPPGSYLVFAHVTAEDMDPVLAERFLPLAAGLPSPIIFRSLDQFRPFFTGLDILEPPGITDISRWSPEGETEEERFPLRSYCAVARKP